MTLLQGFEGRSSMGRLGITMHVTAGYIDPGFCGKITLEISNIGKNACCIIYGSESMPNSL